MDNINNITSEDMKLIKFENIITNLWKKFKNFRWNSSEYGNSPLKFLLGESSNNKYGQIILDKSFNFNIVSKFYGWPPDDCKYFISNDTPNKIDTLINACRVCNRTVSSCGLKMKCNLSSQLIFFALMYVAVDNNNYKEKIKIISDIAYLIGFNEKMMNDWIYVVKMVLKAEKIDLDKLNTKEAKGFFKVLA